MFDKGKWALGNAVPWDIAAGTMVGSRWTLLPPSLVWRALESCGSSISHGKNPIGIHEGFGSATGTWQHFCWVTWGGWCDIYFDSVPSHHLHDSCRTVSICSCSKPASTELHNSAFLLLFFLILNKNLETRWARDSEVGFMSLWSHSKPEVVSWGEASTQYRSNCPSDLATM